MGITQCFSASHSLQLSCFLSLHHTVPKPQELTIRIELQSAHYWMSARVCVCMGVCMIGCIHSAFQEPLLPWVGFISWEAPENLSDVFEFALVSAITYQSGQTKPYHTVIISEPDIRYNIWIVEATTMSWWSKATHSNTVYCNVYPRQGSCFRRIQAA